MRSSTPLDSRTPSAAVGSSRITTFEANAAARADRDRLTLPARHQADHAVQIREVDLEAIEHVARRRRHALSRAGAGGIGGASAGRASSRPA